MIPYKDDNPSYTTPYVNYFIIAVNVLVFGFQLILSESGNFAFVINLGLIPIELLHGANLPESTLLPPSVNLLTSMFLHGGLMHVGGNMLYLYIFGDNIEDALGHVRYAVFYLVAGLAAAAAQVIVSPGSTVPMIGASGAIAGVLGAYLVLYPKARVHTLIFLFIFITTIQLPAVVVLGFWIFLQVLNGLSSPLAGGGVAWFAHIGGFAFGYFVIRYFKKKGKVSSRSRRMRAGQYRIYYN
jgi:rhomboid family protein